MKLLFLLDHTDALQAAVDGASPGDIIVFESGDHSQNGTVQIHQAVRIVGETGAKLTVSGIGPFLDFETPIQVALHISGASNTIIQNLEIVAEGDVGGTAIVIENSENVYVMKNLISNWQNGIVVANGPRAKLFNNTIDISTLWQTEEIPDANGIVIFNGNAVYVVGNTISNAFSGIFTGGRGGISIGNQTSQCFFGQIMCKAFGLILPDERIENAVAATNRWFVAHNHSNDNLFSGYIVIDGSNGNYLTANYGSGNAVYDIEVAGDSERFGFFTPEAYNNTVEAFSAHSVKNCGSNNRILGGNQIDTEADPCY